MTTPRRLFVTARGAGDLKESAGWIPGKTHPYLRIELLPAGSRVHTRPDETGNSENPIWDETFELALPPATPDEELQLRVSVMDSKALLPDTCAARAMVGYAGDINPSPLSSPAAFSKAPAHGATPALCAGPSAAGASC